jgi:hypothetical protein
MDLTTALTGMLPAVVFVSALLTALTSAFLLWIYRRATLRGMQRLIGNVAPFSPYNKREKTVPIRHMPLTIQSQQDETFFTTSAAVEAAYCRTAHSLRTAAVVYATGGLVYALILATPWMIIASNGFFLRRVLWLLVCYAWPIVLTVSLVVATTRWQTCGITCGYFVILSVVALYVLVQNPGLSIGQLVFFWLFANAAGTVLLLAFLHRRIRAVGPLVLAFMVAGVAGAFFPIEIARRSERLLHGLVVVGNVFGLGATALFVLMHVLGFAVLGVLGWWLLGLIGRRYRAKRMSDQSLTIDALWLLFGVVQPITFAYEGWGWIVTGVVAFASYKLVTWAGFTLCRRRGASETNAPMLLLLRVFALGRRSERFFDAFTKWWRRSGSISLIAGPDLVTAVVEPHEFLGFVSGQLSRQFVQDEPDLERRLAALDRQPDPDGRFRVNEFFCHADTWQITMRRLAKESDAVLMDLRSFSHAHYGCLYELEQLLDIVDLERVVFLVDETTDRPFLEETLQHLWQGVDRESPNRRVESPSVHLFHASNHSGQSMRVLLLMLLGMQTATKMINR